MTDNFVDLRSDTLTKPTPAMREAMATAEVGDDVFGEDPTVNALQERVAELLGKESALFVPSGTLGNLLAIVCQTQPGETVILSEDAHPYNYEGGNVAVVGGVMTRTISGRLGKIAAEDVEPAIIRSDDPHFSNTTLIAVENTTNRGAGNIYQLGDLAGMRKLADAHGIRIHCDGARLFNAVVATGTPAADFVHDVDTVSFCFSKGLGAPVGSILAGPADTMKRAHRYRKLLGGGMRQAGILAAGALYALDHHVDRLADDHRRAQGFREGLDSLHGISFPMPTPTNIVIFEVPDAREFTAKAAEHGVFMLPMGPRRVRAVFHLDVTDSGVNRAIEACKQAIS